MAVIPQAVARLADGSLGPGPRPGRRSSLPANGALGGPALDSRHRQRLDAHRPGRRGGACRWPDRAVAATAEGPTWGCGYLMPTVRMQYTGRSFAEMIAEHLLPRFLRPRTTRQAPRGLVSLAERLRRQTSRPGQREAVRAVLPPLGRAIFPAPHSPTGKGPRLSGLHRAHGRPGPGLGVLRR